MYIPQNEIKKTNDTLRVKVQSFTADNLDELAGNGETVLGDYYFTAEEFIAPTLKGGWSCRYVGGKKPGNKGSLVLMPETDWARKIWTAGQINMATRNGLTREQAEKWLASRAKSKHALIKTLARIASKNDPDEIASLLSYDETLQGDALLKWKSRSGITENLHSMRILDLMLLVNDVLVDGDNINKPIIGHTEAVVEPDRRPWEM